MIKLSGPAITSYTIPEFVHPVQAGGTVNYVITHNLNTLTPSLDLYQGVSTVQIGKVYDWNIAEGMTHGYLMHTITENSFTIMLGRISASNENIAGLVYKFN